MKFQIIASVVFLIVAVVVYFATVGNETKPPVASQQNTSDFGNLKIN